MEEVETADQQIQTSLPGSVKGTSFGTSHTSAVSDVSAKSDTGSDSLSATKLDTLHANSVKILVRRSDTIGDYDVAKRLSVVEGIRRPADNAPCELEYCVPPIGVRTTSRNQTVYEKALSRLHGRSTTWVPDNSPEIHGYARPRPLLKSTKNNELQGSQSTLKAGLIGVSVDQNRPYRPQTTLSPRIPLTERNRTTLSMPSSASRHCDACSVKDLRDWFKSHQTVLSRPSNESSLTIGREKSQVYLINKPKPQDGVGANMEEVFLPMTTVPKKGLIKLTCVPDESTNQNEQPAGKRSRRAPIRYLIRNKDILKGVRETYRQLYESNLHTEHPLSDYCNKLTTQDLRHQVLRANDGTGRSLLN